MLQNFSQVRPFIYRSAQPVTPDDFAQIRGLGVKTVIDLENESGEGPWETAEAAKLGIQVLNFPMHSFWPPADSLIAGVQGIMGEFVADGAPLLVHCAHGQDRTGLIVGIWRCRHGYKKRAAWDEMLANGFHPILLGLTGYFWSKA